MPKSYASLSPSMSTPRGEVSGHTGWLITSTFSATTFSACFASPAPAPARRKRTPTDHERWGVQTDEDAVLGRRFEGASLFDKVAVRTREPTQPVYHRHLGAAGAGTGRVNDRKLHGAAQRGARVLVPAEAPLRCRNSASASKREGAGGAHWHTLVPNAFLLSLSVAIFLCGGSVRGFTPGPVIMSFSLQK